MPKFSDFSLANLSTAHPDLQRIFYRVIERFDCRVICGHRGQEAQDAAYREKKSKVKWPNSKHNKLPALAVDVTPWPLNWNDIFAFTALGYFVLGVAHGMRIHIRWGADWNQNMDTRDEGFQDYAHYELMV